MKNIEEFYNEIMASEELKDKLAEASANQKLDEFLKENGIDCTKEQLREYALAKAAESGELSAEEFEAFVKEKECGSRELSDEELESASGGKVVNMYANGKEGFYEVFDEGVDVTEIPAPREWIKSSNLYYCPNCRKQYRINIVRLRDHRELFVYCFGVSGSDALYCPDCRPKQKLILTKEEVHMKA